MIVLGSLKWVLLYGIWTKRYKMKGKGLFFNMIWKCNPNYHISYFKNGDKQNTFQKFIYIQNLFLIEQHFFCYVLPWNWSINWAILNMYPRRIEFGLEFPMNAAKNRFWRNLQAVWIIDRFWFWYGTKSSVLWWCTNCIICLETVKHFTFISLINVGL